MGIRVKNKETTLILLLAILSSLLLVLYSKLAKDPCEWRITNCCPENAGAKWECVDIRKFKEPNCTKLVLCPQVLSPKPNLSCVYENGSCVVK